MPIIPYIPALVYTLNHAFSDIFSLFNDPHSHLFDLPSPPIPHPLYKTISYTSSPSCLLSFYPSYRINVDIFLPSLLSRFLNSFTYWSFPPLFIFPQSGYSTGPTHSYCFTPALPFQFFLSYSNLFPLLFIPTNLPTPFSFNNSPRTFSQRFPILLPSSVYSSCSPIAKFYSSFNSPFGSLFAYHLHSPLGVLTCLLLLCLLISLFLLPFSYATSLPIHLHFSPHSHFPSSHALSPPFPFLPNIFFPLIVCFFSCFYLFPDFLLMSSLSCDTSLLSFFAIFLPLSRYLLKAPSLV